MIEETIRDYLNGELSVPVFLETPENPPESYVLIERTGGGMENYICTAMVVVQSIAETLFKAAALNYSTIDAMVNIWKYRDISRCHLNSTYNATDVRFKKYRYEAVFDLTF